MKIKTPEEIAKAGPGKDKFTLYLDKSNMDYLRQRATKAGTSTSQIVNEAISAYIATLKQKKNDQ